MEFIDGYLPEGRNSTDDFIIGDSIMAKWDDGIFYEATILKINGMLIE